jgi:hypothetical protein
VVAVAGSAGGVRDTWGGRPRRRAQAKALVEALPATIMKGLKKEDAEALLAKLKELECTCTLE